MSGRREWGKRGEGRMKDATEVETLEGKQAGGILGGAGWRKWKIMREWS